MPGQASLGQPSPGQARPEPVQASRGQTRPDQNQPPGLPGPDKARLAQAQAKPYQATGYAFDMLLAGTPGSVSGMELESSSEWVLGR